MSVSEMSLDNIARTGVHLSVSTADYPNANWRQIIQAAVDSGGHLTIRNSRTLDASRLIQFGELGKGHLTVEI